MKELKLLFNAQRQTANTMRYGEVLPPADGQYQSMRLLTRKEAAVFALYLSKKHRKALGNPELIEVLVRPVST